jgi:hypothetical protein
MDTTTNDKRSDDERGVETPSYMEVLPANISQGAAATDCSSTPLSWVEAALQEGDFNIPVFGSASRKYDVVVSKDFLTHSTCTNIAHARDKYRYRKQLNDDPNMASQAASDLDVQSFVAELERYRTVYRNFCSAMISYKTVKGAVHYGWKLPCGQEPVSIKDCIKVLGETDNSSWNPQRKLETYNLVFGCYRRAKSSWVQESIEFFMKAAKISFEKNPKRKTSETCFSKLFVRTKNEDLRTPFRNQMLRRHGEFVGDRNNDKSGKYDIALMRNDVGEEFKVFWPAGVPPRVGVPAVGSGICVYVDLVSGRSDETRDYRKRRALEDLHNTVQKLKSYGMDRSLIRGKFESACNFGPAISPGLPEGANDSQEEQEANDSNNRMEIQRVVPGQVERLLGRQVGAPAGTLVGRNTERSVQQPGETSLNTQLRTQAPNVRVQMPAPTPQFQMPAPTPQGETQVGTQVETQETGGTTEDATSGGSLGGTEGDSLEESERQTEPTSADKRREETQLIMDMLDDSDTTANDLFKRDGAMPSTVKKHQKAEMIDSAASGSSSEEDDGYDDQGMAFVS